MSPVCAGAGPPPPHLLLLLEERLLPELLRLPERLVPRALARSLWALLFWVLALPPLLAACARLERPDDGEDLEEEEEELRDAMACSLGRWLDGRQAITCSHGVNLGRSPAAAVGLHRPTA